VADGKRDYTLAENVAAIHGKYSYEKHAETDSYAFTYGASGFDINFTGTDLWIYIPEVPTEDKDGTTVTHETSISVRVDSEYAMDATMMNVTGAGWMPVATGLSEGDHTVCVRKQSRGFFGIMASDWFAVSQVAVNEAGKITTPYKLSDLVIECYGDSISNGDAVWLNEDGTNSAYTNGNWTGVLERLLDAEVKVTANTGNGLLGWCMASKNGQLDNLLPPQANWAVIDNNHNQTEYSHTGANETDVVIINLGTNDRADLGSGDMTHKAFADEYVRFIKQIHTDCPNAIVICTIGAMGGQQEWSDTLGGAGMDYVEYEWQDGEFTRTLVEGAAVQSLLGAGIATVGTAFDSGVKIGDNQRTESVNDGNLSTGWQPQNKGSMGNNCYAGVLFDHAVKMTGATVDWEGNTRPEASEQGYRIEVTTDGKTWFVPDGIAYQYSSVTDGTSSDVITFNEIAAVGARVVCLKSTNDKYASQLYEFGVTSEEKAPALIKESDVKHFDSVIDQCNTWAGSTFCYFVEIQKCDTIGANDLTTTGGKDIPAGAGYDNGHPSNLAGEIYGLQYATLINKVLNLNKELPTDIPAYAFEKRTGKQFTQGGSLLEYLTGRTDTLSYIDEVIARAKNGK